MKRIICVHLVYIFSFCIGAIGVMSPQSGPRMRRSGPRAMTSSSEQQAYQARRQAGSELKRQQMNFNPDLTNEDNLEAVLENPALWARKYVAIYEMPEWENQYSKQQIHEFVNAIATFFNYLKEVNFNKEVTLADIQNTLSNIELPDRLKDNFSRTVEPLLAKALEKEQAIKREEMVGSEQKPTVKPKTKRIPAKKLILKSRKKLFGTIKREKAIPERKTNRPARTSNAEIKVDVYKKLLKPEYLDKAKLLLDKRNELDNTDRGLRIAGLLENMQLLYKMSEAQSKQPDLNTLDSARQSIATLGSPEGQIYSLADNSNSYQQNKLLEAIIAEYVINHPLFKTHQAAERAEQLTD